jgi:hypothetical protein
MPAQPIGCLGFLFRLFGLKSDATSDAAKLPQVHVNKYFVSNAEANFFRVLRRVVGDRGHVLAQVSLRQLLWFPGSEHSNRGRAGWRNKVAAKTVDFVVCDPGTLRPKVVVELDEPSHTRPERQTRDDEVDVILEAAKLPVLRVLTSRSYETRELEAAIGPYLR